MKIQSTLEIAGSHAILPTLTPCQVAVAGLQGTGRYLIQGDLVQMGGELVILVSAAEPAPDMPLYMNCAGVVAGGIIKGTSLVCDIDGYFTGNLAEIRDGKAYFSGVIASKASTPSAQVAAVKLTPAAPIEVVAPAIAPAAAVAPEGVVEHGDAIPVVAAPVVFEPVVVPAPVVEPAAVVVPLVEVAPTVAPVESATEKKTEETPAILPSQRRPSVPRVVAGFLDIDFPITKGYVPGLCETPKGLAPQKPMPVRKFGDLLPATAAPAIAPAAATEPAAVAALPVEGARGEEVPYKSPFVFANEEKPEAKAVVPADSAKPARKPENVPPTKVASKNEIGAEETEYY